MDGVVVRRVSLDEVEEVARFAEAFDDPIHLESARVFLADERHHLVVAYVDAQPAGFVSATEVFHPDKRGPELFLNEIGVIERFRRRGAGAAMLDELKLLGAGTGMPPDLGPDGRGQRRRQGLYEKAGGAS